MVLTTKVQKRKDSGQLTITIPKDFAEINHIDKGTVFEFYSEKGEFIIDAGDIILRRKS